jgi:hypothetical protein
MRVSFFYRAVAQEPRFSGFSEAKAWKRPPTLRSAGVKHGKGTVKLSINQD